MQPECVREGLQVGIAKSSKDVGCAVCWLEVVVATRREHPAFGVCTGPEKPRPQP